MSKEKWERASKAIGVRTSEGRRMIYPSHRVGEGGALVKPKQRIHPGKRLSFKRKGRNLNGQTAFYRHPTAMHQIIDWASRQAKEDVRMLVMPSSIGCEPYSFAMMAENAGLGSKLTIDAFDISDEFLRVARQGAYPAEALIGLPEELLQHFNMAADGEFAEVSDAIKAHVNFLPHCSLKRFKADEPYDIVVSQNFLKHVEGAPWDKPKTVKKEGYDNKQAAAIRKLCQLTAEGGALFVDMIEETPFAFHYTSPPFNPFKENGMVYLNANLRPYRNGRVYPRKESEVLQCVRERNLVHALQKRTPQPL